MAVASSLNKVVYTADGENRTWTYSFPLLDASHLQIYVTDLNGNDTLYTTGYTVDMTTSTVTFPMSQKVAAIDSGYKVTLLRELPIVQNTDLNNQDAMEAETLEDAYDYLTMVAQQLNEKVGRSLKSSVSSYMYVEGGNSGDDGVTTEDIIAQYEDARAAYEAAVSNLNSSTTMDKLTSMVANQIELFYAGTPTIDEYARAQIADVSQSLSAAIQTGDQTAVSLYESASEAYLSALASLEDWKGVMKDAGINPIKDADGNVTGYQIYAVEKSKDDLTGMLTTAKSEILTEAEKVAITSARTAAVNALAGNTIDEISGNVLSSLREDLDEQQLLLDNSVGKLTVTPDEINSYVENLQIWSGDKVGDSPFSVYARTQIANTAEAIREEAAKLYVDLDTLDTHIAQAAVTITTELGASVDTKVIDGIYKIEGESLSQSLSNLLTSAATSLKSREYNDLNALLNSKIAYADSNLRAYVNSKNEALTEKVSSQVSVMQGNYATANSNIMTLATEQSALSDKVETYKTEITGDNGAIAQATSEVQNYVRNNYATSSRIDTILAQAVSGTVTDADGNTSTLYSEASAKEYINTTVNDKTSALNKTVSSLVTFRDTKFAQMSNVVNTLANGTHSTISEITKKVAASESNYAGQQKQLSAEASKTAALVSSVDTLQTRLNNTAAEIKQIGTVSNNEATYQLQLRSETYTPVSNTTKAIDSGSTSVSTTQTVNKVSAAAVAGMAMSVNSKTGESTIGFTANNFFICNGNLIKDNKLNKSALTQVFTTYDNNKVGINGDLFVSGTITADKLAANSVTAGKIVSQSISNDKLSTNSVSTVKIVSNAVSNMAYVSGREDSGGGYRYCDRLGHSGYDNWMTQDVYITFCGSGMPVAANITGAGEQLLFLLSGTYRSTEGWIEVAWAKSASRNNLDYFRTHSYQGYNITPGWSIFGQVLNAGRKDHDYGSYTLNTTYTTTGADVGVRYFAPVWRAMRGDEDCWLMCNMSQWTVTMFHMKR